jgi:hypothetical protein
MCVGKEISAKVYKENGHWRSQTSRRKWPLKKSSVKKMMRTVRS